VKILILKPSSLGDVVQALPVLRLIKRHLPQSEIYWWIETRLAPLLEGDPDLAGLILFDRQRWAHPQHWGEVVRSVQAIRAQKFDWIIDLQCLLRSGVVAWLSGAKLLVGLDEPREGARAFYDLVARRPSFHTHAVDWYLGVLPLLGIPLGRDFEWLPHRTETAAAIRRRWPLQQHRWLLVQPGARWLNKRWPIDHYADLLRQVAAQHSQFHFAILGGVEDQSLGQSLVSAVNGRCLDLTGQLTLPEMVEWVRAGELMVTNDTGPMHVAAALGKPVVALFGPTEPRRTGPYGQIEHVLQLDLPCAPCLKSRCAWTNPSECLSALPVAAALDALERRLSSP
jgi:heptosyltransferase I